MSRIADDILKGAEWISKCLVSSGYNADFSPESIWQIDFFFDDHSLNGKAITGGLLSKDLGSRLFALGGYVGEVLRRNIDGEWYGDDSDTYAEINIELRLKSGVKCWPVQRIMNRFKNGEEDSMAAYANGLGLQIGSKPSHFKRQNVKKPWWSFFK